MHTWIEAAFLSFGLITARVSAFVATVPYFGGVSTPRLIKAALVLALAVFWFLTLGAEPAAALRSHDGEIVWLKYVLALGREILLGGMLGYIFSLFTVPFRTAGEFIGQEMGLTLASISDPTQGTQTSVLGQVFETIGVLLFFGLNIHHVFLAAPPETSKPARRT